MFNVSSRINTTHDCVNSCTEETNKLNTIYLATSICINIVGILTNSIIIFVYQTNKQLKTKSNVIIVTVGVASIVVAASEIVCASTYMLSRVHYPTKHWLTVQKCIEAVVSYYSIKAIAVNSVQRLLITSHMQRPNAHTNLLKTKILLLMVGSFTAITSITVVSMFNTVWLNITFYMSCNITELDSKNNFYWMIYNTLFSILPSCVTIGSYIYIENRIGRKSGTLHRKIKRTSLNRGGLTRADMKTSWSITIILVFIVTFHFPREVLTYLLMTQRKLLPYKWLYLVSVLMSNVFQQFIPITHAWAGTRYRSKLRKSLSRTTIQTKKPGNSSKWFASDATQRRRLNANNNQHFDRYNSASIVTKNHNNQNNIQILHSFYDPSTNDNNKNGRFSVQYGMEKESVILGIGKISKEVPNVESEHGTIQHKKNAYKIRRRRFSDSEVTMNNTICHYLKTNKKLVIYHTYSDTNGS